MRKLLFLAKCLFFVSLVTGQATFPVNGVADQKVSCYAFTHATIVIDSKTTLKDATLLIRNGRIAGVGTSVNIPADAQLVDCADKFIYPSFIEIFSDYGLVGDQRATAGAGGFSRTVQLETNQKGAFGWNQAMKADTEAWRLFAADAVKAKSLRETGFGTVLTHQKDGIARGTGAVVTLANEKENLLFIREKAANFLSFSKGSSTQSYPGSLMGVIALLRQTYLDGQWYKTTPAAEGVNITLKSWNENLDLPQIMDPNDRGQSVWNILRGDRVGDEFGKQYILKATGKEYQRINEVKGTNAPLIVSLNFPDAQDVEDPADARFVSLSDLKHWELAPTNPAAIEKAGIAFALSAADLRDGKTFFTNLRKALENGLSEAAALDALTKTPASLLGIYPEVGSIETGKIASFLVTNGPIFKEKTSILQNWVQGQKFGVKEEEWTDFKGNYQLAIETKAGVKNYPLLVKTNGSADVIARDTVAAKFSVDGKLVKLSFNDSKKSKAGYRLSGVNNEGIWQGTGVDSAGNALTWTATLKDKGLAKKDSAQKPTPKVTNGELVYPFLAFGNAELPAQETILIKNATIWTSDEKGKLEGTDLLIKNGKIASIGKNLSGAGARVIDGTGKHLTAGIIDEHSHIAVASINEGGQSISSEVRIADNLNPDDINIYRQLSGGVTTSHILHGSANTIGGQTQLIKLRWGAGDEALKFKGADGFIKFALGENVKRTTATQGNPRYPDTRMGVEQVLTDAFSRAKTYEAALKKSKGTAAVRRDLELDALVEIMNKKRFITCHSYVASEITNTMRVAEKFGFTINTFTHILEGYKVADKMKAHGANVSTFSDWWAYKMEVQDAIPYNAYIMQKVGLNVAINSDDAEMARHLNHEAAKSVKYAGMNEEEALKMVTINPAKMLHIDKQVGSLREGKDADLVLWSDHPLSVYAKSLYTIVDGTVYFDREKDLVARKKVADERQRLIQKMIGEKAGGRTVRPAQPSYREVLTCGDHDHHGGMLDVHEED